jgi:hypothetical protein
MSRQSRFFHRIGVLPIACLALLAVGGGSASAASVSTGTEALEVTRDAASVTGSVNPEGQDTHYYWQYGLDTTYGQNAPSVQGEDAGEGSTPVNVSIRLTGLTPQTVYHYRLVASNGQGTIIATGLDQSFMTGPPTPPSVTVESASNITLTTATLTGLIDPMGLETSYVLELGTEPSYGTSISGEVGASSETVTVNVPVIELAPGTTYHYRFVAVNPDGRVYGADRTFSTPVYEHPIVLPSAEPLLAVPAIVFPTGTEQTNTPKHKTKPVHKKHKTKHKKHKRKHKHKKR